MPYSIYLRYINKTAFILALIFSTLTVCYITAIPSHAQGMNKIDLKVTMKSMRLEFTKAMETQSSDEFNQRISTISELLTQAQGYNFSPDRAKISLEGLDKVAVIITDMQQTRVTPETLLAAKDRLKQVDNLRKEYHKKSKPSIWQLIFG